MAASFHAESMATIANTPREKSNAIVPRRVRLCAGVLDYPNIGHPNRPCNYAVAEIIFCSLIQMNDAADQTK